MVKTLYLWDMANTLFPEKWNARKSGFPNYEVYVKSLGYDLKTISPRDYEWAYERPYCEGLFDLSITKGFKKVLSWTKNNAVFTTGNREQIDWRTENFLKQSLFDPRPYFKKIHSTFDFGNTNKKTKKMIILLVKKIINNGYKTVVYTDDKLANCLFFEEAAKKIKRKGFKVRIYHLTNRKSGIKNKGKYFEIGNLFDLLKNEKKL
ncbi:MAG: hypothetical protein Q8M83_02785 [bacterium]|nr:hypothetical protein [bacterium]